jgi:NADPH:quinone reductase-like Zn-dependent oxidoreductase
MTQSLGVTTLGQLKKWEVKSPNLLRKVIASLALSLVATQSTITTERSESTPQQKATSKSLCQPDSLSFEEAATLGVGITTVGQGLYQSLKLPLPGKPSSKKTSILVYGGSTATGSLAIQFAKLSGLQVIATCSPHNFEYIKSLGAGELNHSGSKLC